VRVALKITVVVAALFLCGYAITHWLDSRLPPSLVRQAQTYKRWAALPCEPLLLDGRLFERLMNLPILNHADLSALEISELRSAVSNLVTHSALNTFETYLKFRVPCPAALDLSEFVEDYLGRAEELGVRVPTDEEERFRVYWQVRSFGTNMDQWRFDSLSFEDSEISVVATNRAQSLIATAERLFPQGSQFQTNRYFRYPETVASVLKKEGQIKWAVVRLMLKSCRGDPFPQPVSVAYYWSPGCAKWMPDELVISKNPPPSYTFLF
jgi:hypothetical protein